MGNAYPEWRRLEELLDAIKSKGIEKLPAEELLDFGRWYRRAAAELSFLRTREADADRLAYMNDLLGQCYPYVYTAPRRPWPSVRRFFVAEFPQALRRHRLYIIMAFLIAMIPALIGFALTRHDRSIADQVLPPELLQSSDQVAERHDAAHDWLPLLERAPSAAFILTNNISVSIIAFAGGMTAGIITLISMAYNGMMLGVVAAVVSMHGAATTLNFWGFVAPHGVIELTAIFIAGGAGLLLAYAIVNPGEMPRRIAVREAGKEALKLMLGVAAMLVIAGFIEAFFSPLVIPESIKFAVAAVEGVFLFSYFIFAGRSAKEEHATPYGTLMTPVPPM